MANMDMMAQANHLRIRAMWLAGSIASEAFRLYIVLLDG